MSVHVYTLCLRAGGVWASPPVITEMVILTVQESEHESQREVRAFLKCVCFLNSHKLQFLPFASSSQGSKAVSP